MRDDFNLPTKDILTQRVGMRCSNPKCRKLTGGPRAAPDKAINIGVAAHITAASPGGPRYDANINQNQRTSIHNGIWLCQNCAKLVDNDCITYTEKLLRQWKKQAEESTEKQLQGCTSSISADPPDLTFATETVNETDGGFRVQFSLANSSPRGQINVFNVVPVLVFRHYFMSYYETEPHTLPPITLCKLQLMQEMNPGVLFQSGDGLFGAGNLIQGKTYRLPPHEMDTFGCQFVVAKKPSAVWTIGFLVKFSDSLGNKRQLPSDCVFAINNEQGFSLAQYDLSKLQMRLAESADFEFYDDVTVGFDGCFRIADEADEQPQPNDDGVVTIEFDPNDMYEISEGIPCDWFKMFSKSKQFLSLEPKSWKEMKPT